MESIDDFEYPTAYAWTVFNVSWISGIRVVVHTIENLFEILNVFNKRAEDELRDCDLFHTSDALLGE